MENLTILEAFKAMTEFLEIHYNQTNSDDVGGLLGDMMLLEDGNTADPAVWEDWMRSIEKIKQNN